MGQHVIDINKSSRFDNLRKISFSDQTLSDYSEYFGKLVNRVEECDLSYCLVSRRVIREFSKEIVKGTKLKKLNMRGTRILTPETDIPNQPHHQLLGFGEALVKLTEVNFCGTNVLEGRRLTETFDTLHKLGSLEKLKNLNISSIQTAYWIEAKAFGQIMNKLEVLNLRNSTVTKDQFNSLLDVMQVGTNLRVLKMGDNRLSLIKDICSSKLAIALNNVEELELWPCEFTHIQVLSVLARIEQKTNLKRLFIDEETDRYLSYSYPQLYLELRSRISRKVLFSLLPY